MSTNEGKIQFSEGNTSLVKKYIILKLGELEYAAPLSEVKEVIALPQVVPVPGAPEYFKGLINLRGKVVSIIDLAEKMKIQQHVENKKKVILITEIGETQIGCIVDGVTEVMTLSENQIEKNLEVNLAGQKNFCIGMAKFDNRPMILILDVKKSVNIEEIIKLKDSKVA
jgi:purine-binding chemotaxis protein CheW